MWCNELTTTQKHQGGAIMMQQKNDSVNTQIDGFETTHQSLTGRAGLTIVSRYIRANRITELLHDMFGFLRKSAKGQTLSTIFKQLLLFFIDGTDFHLTRFDQLKRDKAYAQTIEVKQSQLLSSHAMKRFFASFTRLRVFLFRKVLQSLFLWRLQIEQPKTIKIGIDTMVLDNDDALKREGVEPTYKKVKGFQPLQAYWGRFLIDAIFREGKAHSNHGNHVQRMVVRLVQLIRRHYKADVPIILLADTGFYDEKLFLLCEKLEIGFIIGGKIYQDIAEFVTSMPDKHFFEYAKHGKSWLYCEFGHKRKSWTRFWRTVYACSKTDDTKQYYLEFARPDTILHTNLGMNNAVTNMLIKIHNQANPDQLAKSITPEALLRAYHNRARDELVNRGIKDFGTEQLPFKNFTANAAYYYVMAIAFNLFEAFKHDIKSEVVPISMFASTFRRKVLDLAGQIIHHARKTIIKISSVAAEALDFSKLWENSLKATQIILV